MTGRYHLPAEPFSAYTDGAFEDETPDYELEMVPPSTYETEPEVWQNISGWLNRAGDWFSGLAQPGTPTSPAVPTSPALPAASGAPVARSSPAYIRWVQSALNRILGLNLAVDGKNGSRTKAAVRAFQTRQGLVVDGKVGTATERALIAAGAGNPPVSSTPATPTSSQINTPLPASGPGYYAYQTNQARRYGIPETIQALQAVGLMWSRRYPNGPRIGIGDISKPGGGPFPPHKSHQLGVDADVRLMRSDRREAGGTFRDPSYSRTMTQELVNLFLTNPVLRVKFILFNDPSVTGVKYYEGHDNHLHVRFIAPAATQQEVEEEWGPIVGWLQDTAGRLLGSAASQAGRVVNRQSPDYVRWLQASLNRVRGTRVPVDGTPGPRTRAALQDFQRVKGLRVDGIPGPASDAALLAAGAEPIPASAYALPSHAGPPAAPAPGAVVPCAPPSNITEAERNALAVTSLLEGGRSFHCRVSSVDGISMGMIQWNLAAGTLQEKLALFDQRTHGGLQKYFDADTQLVRNLVRMRGSRELHRQAVAKARSENLHGRWKSVLEQLCADPDFCTIQQEDIRSRLCSAWEGVSVVGLASVRGLCMMFDINTGDGLSRAKMHLLRQGLDAEQTRLGRALAEADKLSLLADLAANRLTQYREERRARRKNLAGIPTLYRGDRRWAERINATIPNLDRALTAEDRSVC